MHNQHLKFIERIHANADVKKPDLKSAARQSDVFNAFLYEINYNNRSKATHYNDVRN